MAQNECNEISKCSKCLKCGHGSSQYKIQPGWSHKWISPKNNIIVRDVVPGPFSSPKLLKSSPFVTLSACKPHRAKYDKELIRRGIPDPWLESIAVKGTHGLINKFILKKNQIPCCVRLEVTEKMWHKFGFPLVQGIPDPVNDFPARQEIHKLRKKKLKAAKCPRPIHIKRHSSEEEPERKNSKSTKNRCEACIHVNLSSKKDDLKEYKKEPLATQNLNMGIQTPHELLENKPIKNSEETQTEFVERKKRTNIETPVTLSKNIPVVHVPEKKEPPIKRISFSSDNVSYSIPRFPSEESEKEFLVTEKLLKSKQKINSEEDKKESPAVKKTNLPKATDLSNKAKSNLKEAKTEPSPTVKRSSFSASDTLSNNKSQMNLKAAKRKESPPIKKSSVPASDTLSNIKPIVKPRAPKKEPSTVKRSNLPTLDTVSSKKPKIKKKDQPIKSEIGKIDQKKTRKKIKKKKAKSKVLTEVDTNCQTQVEDISIQPDKKNIHSLNDSVDYNDMKVQTDPFINGNFMEGTKVICGSCDASNRRMECSGRCDDRQIQVKVHNIKNCHKCRKCQVSVIYDRNTCTDKMNMDGPYIEQVSEQNSLLNGTYFINDYQPDLEGSETTCITCENKGHCKTTESISKIRNRATRSMEEVTESDTETESDSGEFADVSSDSVVRNERLASVTSVTLLNKIKRNNLFTHARQSISSESTSNINEKRNNSLKYDMNEITCSCDPKLQQKLRKLENGTDNSTKHCYLKYRNPYFNKAMISDYSDYSNKKSY